MRHPIALLAVCVLFVLVPALDSDGAVTHTVTFQMPDGTVLSTQQVEDGGYVDLSAIPSPPIPEGATFTGWGDVTQRITSDTMFTASFDYSSKTFVVRYYGDDRITLMHTETVESGKAAVYDIIPRKADSEGFSYVFERWSEELSCVTSDLSVYPVFKEFQRMCKVHFHDYDRSLLYTVEVPYGSDLVDMPEAPTRASTIGYTYEFECWSITPNGYSPASFTDITDTRFVYAYYKPTLASYTVSFVLDGETVDAVSMRYNSQIDASAVLDVRDGFIAKMYRDPELTRELPIGYTVIGDTDVFIDLVPGNYSCERDASGRVVTDRVDVSHDADTISSLKGRPYVICDISQFPNGTAASIDHTSLVLISRMLGADAPVTVSLPRGSVTVAVSELVALTDGDILFSITNGPSSVKITSALKKIDYVSYLSVSVKADGRTVTSIPGAVLSFGLSLDEGLNPVAWSITSKGQLTAMDSSYDGISITFSSDTVRYFVLGTDSPVPTRKNDGIVMPYGSAEYSLSGSGSVYGLDDSPQSNLTSISGTFGGNVLFVPSSFDDRPLMRVSADAFAGVTDAAAIVIPVTVRSFDWIDWSCTVKDVYFLGDRPEFVGEVPSFVRLHAVSGRDGWAGYDAEMHERYLYNGSVGKDPFEFRFVLIEGKAYLDRYVSGSYVTIPGAVMADGREYPMAYIGDSAFMRTDDSSIYDLFRLEYGSNTLETVEIPASVTEILATAFRQTPLKYVYGMESVEHIGDGAFRNCTKLTPVTFGSSLLYVGHDAFLACSSKAFSRVALPSSVMFVGTSAFYGCSGLVNVSVDCGITEVADSCFAQCSSLTNISLPESVTRIGNSAFYNCSSLLYIDLVNCETVGASAFQCTGQGSRLECVVFGESLRSVGRSAFADCGDLAEMEVYCERPEGMDDAFRGVDLGAVRFYATSAVAGSWAGYEVELLDAVEEDEDNTMTYVVLWMVLFFIVAGVLSVKYRTKFE